MQVALLFCLLSIIPSPSDGTTNYVNRVEINHFYDNQNGRLVFDQILVYDVYRVRQWFLIRNGRTPKLTPDEIKALEAKDGLPYVPDFNCPDLQIKRDGTKYIVWYNDKDVLYRISCFTVDHTWTDYDPELLDRERLQKEARIPLIPWESR